MSRGYGELQKRVMEFVGASWWENNSESVLVSELFAELRRSHYTTASISRALKSLVSSGVLVRRGDVVYMSESLRLLERQQTMESDIGNGLPWWCRKEFQAQG